nr:F-box domain, leucine-rich repeat domain, L domain-like protein [Tanacetum cinerariifolium]
MSPGNVAGDKSGTKTRSEFTDSYQNPSPQPGRAESTADRVHNRAVAAAVVAIAAVAAETQPKMLPGPTVVMVEVRTPPPHHVPSGCIGCFANRGKGKRKPNLGGRTAGRLNTRDKTRNLSLKEITDTKGSVSIQLSCLTNKPLCLSVTMRLIGLATSGRRERPENITASEWDKYIQSWNDPSNIAWAAQNRQNRAKSTIISRQGSRGRAQPLRSTRRSLTPSLWHSLLTGNFFRMRIDEEMRRLEATGTYTDDEINRLARGGKQRGHILSVGRVLPARATASPSMPAHESTHNSLHKKVDFMMSLFKSDSKYSYMFSQFELGGANGSGGCEDDEEGADDQADEDEDGDGDT